MLSGNYQRTRGLLAPMSALVLIAALGCGTKSDSPADETMAGDDDDDDDAGDDDDVGGDDDDDDGGDDDSASGTGEGTENNTCVPGIGDCPDGQKCLPYIKEEGGCCVDANMCVTITGDKQLGEPCSPELYSDDCAKDLYCIDGEPGVASSGHCKALCDGSDIESCVDNGIADTLCLAFNDGALPLCTSECHPLRPDCAEGEGCYWGGVFFCHKTVFDPGKGKEGDDCGTINGCSPGMLCNVATVLEGCESSYCCTMFCDLEGDGGECEGGEACVAMFAKDDAEADPTTA